MGPQIIRLIGERCDITFLGNHTFICTWWAIKRPTWQKGSIIQASEHKLTTCIILANAVMLKITADDLFSNLFFVFRECEVYTKNHAAPFSKVITFHKKEPFDLEAFYSCPHELPYPDSRIGVYYCVCVCVWYPQYHADYICNGILKPDFT